MKINIVAKLFGRVALGCLLLVVASSLQQVRAADEDPDPNPDVIEATAPHHHHVHHHDDDAVVSIGHNADLAAGQHADSVVAVFGSATSSGEVDDAVVSVLGSTRVEGGEVHDSAVAVFGSNYVNSVVDGDVVAVLGNVTLGPQARVRGDVVAVAGTLVRDPAATVGGQVQHVFNVNWSGLEWLRQWFERCLLYGRLLSFDAGLAWAWGVALGLLALYALIAFVFRSGVERCVQTLETHPGQSIITALATVLALPVLFVLLLVTLVGIIAIPFLALAVIGAEIFGKIAILAYVGRRFTSMLSREQAGHTVICVLVGGIVALLIYTIPLLGVMMYKLLDVLALGVVVYALLAAVRAGRQPVAAAPGSAAGGTAPGGSPPPDAMFSAAAADAAASASGTPGGPTVGMSTPEQPRVPISTLPRAGFGIRMAGLLIDMVLVALVLHICHISDDFYIMALAIYGAVMWKTKGSTVGGSVCGLRVVRLDARPIDWATAVVRALSCFLSMVVVGLGFIWIAIDPGKQSWHDKIAGTAVVRVPHGVSLV